MTTKKEFENKLRVLVHDTNGFYGLLNDFIYLSDRDGINQKNIEWLVMVIKKKKEQGVFDMPNALWFAYKNLKENDND